MMMVSIGLSIRRNVRKLRPVSAIRKSGQQAIRKLLSIVQKALECHALRDGAIVEEHTDRLTRWQPHQISAARIDPIAGHVFPRSAAFPSHAFCLSRGEDCERDAVLGQNFQTLGIYRRLWEPHSFRMPSEPLLEVGNSPFHLRYFIPSICERQDHMVVTLRDRRP